MNQGGCKAETGQMAGKNPKQDQNQRMLSMVTLRSVSRVIPWGLGGLLATLTMLAALIDVKNLLTGKDPDAGKD